MSQHAMTIANQAGAAFRGDLNNMAAAIATLNSGATAPTTTYSYQPWGDTTTGLLKQRNAANSAWVILGGLSQAYLGHISASHFEKPSSGAHCFSKTGAGTLSVLANTRVMAGGTIVTFSADTAITMPTLTSGTDYAIYVCTDGTIRADANFSAPTGYTTANSRKIGGFHYSPGGHSGAPGGGDTTPQINVYSLWDLKFKPACPDPRGMALVAGGFWSDIYLLGVDHITNGTSKYNITIADGASPPKVPTQFGGNGTTTYTSLNWWEAGEVLASAGKRLPRNNEFAALAYGTTEATSIGADPVSTTWASAYISKWGCAQVSGTMWQWAADFGGGAAAAGWVANTVSRGSTYQLENAAIFGGGWADTSNAGSRCSSWSNSPTYSGNAIGARGVCDHLILE